MNDPTVRIKVVHPTQMELYDRALAAIQRLKPEGIGCTNTPANADWADLEFYLAAYDPRRTRLEAKPVSYPIPEDLKVMYTLQKQVARSFRNDPDTVEIATRTRTLIERIAQLEAGKGEKDNGNI